MWIIVRAVDNNSVYSDGSNSNSESFTTKINLILARKPQTILLVDDEPMVVALVGTVLDREGYRVMRAGSPFNALELAEGPDGAPDLLLTDITMPLLNGPLLARAVQRAYPATRILFMTAQWPDVDGDLGIPQDADVLRKPFRLPELVERVRMALAERPATAAC